MNVNLVPYLVIWVVLAAVVIVLFAWRQAVARKEDDTVHVLGNDTSPEQNVVAQKLEMIDKWGKLATLVAVVFGVLLGAAYIAQVWINTSRHTVG